jgi:hypothetical protein
MQISLDPIDRTNNYKYNKINQINIVKSFKHRLKIESNEPSVRGFQHIVLVESKHLIDIIDVDQVKILLQYTKVIDNV